LALRFPAVGNRAGAIVLADTGRDASADAGADIDASPGRHCHAVDPADRRTDTDAVAPVDTYADGHPDHDTDERDRHAGPHG
jgi:hypothetical protein